MTTTADDLHVDHDVARQIIAYSAMDPAHEQCGLVYGRSVVWISNRASDPVHYFKMDDVELLEAYTDLGNPDAIWHSHPSGNPEPSEADVDGAPPGVLYLIVAGGLVHPYRF